MNEPILHLSLVSLLLRKIHRKADAMQIDLNLDIDCQATAHKVTQFLDKKLDRYLALSGKRRFDLKSPSMDGMPKAPAKERQCLVTITTTRQPTTVTNASCTWTCTTKSLTNATRLGLEDDDSCTTVPIGVYEYQSVGYDVSKIIGQ